MIPIFLDTVLQTLSMWYFQESLLSIVIPKNFVLLTSLTLYLPHFESQYLVHLQILIKIAQETSSFHTYGVNDLLDLPGEHCVKRRIRRD